MARKPALEGADPDFPVPPGLCIEARDASGWLELLLAKIPCRHRKPEIPDGSLPSALDEDLIGDVREREFAGMEARGKLSVTHEEQLASDYGSSPSCSRRSLKSTEQNMHAKRPVTPLTRYAHAIVDQLLPSSPASSEVSEPGKEAAERRHSMNQMPEDDTHITISVPNATSVLPSLSVQDLDRAWRAQNAALAWLSQETLHCAVDADYGIHPSHPLWAGKDQIMLSNIPCRCRKHELENFISATAAAAGVSPEEWRLVLPSGSGGRNRGYAFIRSNIGNPEATTVELVRALWQKRIPTRSSQKPLKLQPELKDAEIARFRLVLGSDLIPNVVQ